MYQIGRYSYRPDRSSPTRCSETGSLCVIATGEPKWAHEKDFLLTPCGADAIIQSIVGAW